MKLNNKGFTLVELLAVLVILVTILLIAIPSITSTISRNQDKELQARKDLIVSEMEAYAMSHKNSTTQFRNGTCAYSTEQIQNKNMISKDNLLNSEGNLIEGCIYYHTTNKEYVFENPCSKTLCSD